LLLEAVAEVVLNLAAAVAQVPIRLDLLFYPKDKLLKLSLAEVVEEQQPGIKLF
jgi:hypothetical protein